MSDLLPVSAALADFVADSSPSDLPNDVRHAAKRSLLNMMATALAGSADPAIGIAAATLATFQGTPTATVIGRRERTDPATAAFLNAAAANVHDFDDTHIRTVIHPTAPVAPALLALAQHRARDLRVSGRDLVHALALGIEATCRIGNAVSPEHYARGWHITATCGVFGAAAATARLLALDRARTLFALGGAAAQASGLVETLGFMAKSIGVGAAARGGLLAALMAERGMDGPDRPLEGPRGFLTVTGEAPRLDEVTGELGKRWEMLANIHKPYPCGIVLNAPIDACLELRREAGFDPSSVERITLRGHPLLRQRADRPAVSTGRESQVSAQHAVAATLVFGAAGLDQFSDAAVADPRVQALRRRVFVVDDPSHAVAGVGLTLETRDGAVRSIVVDHARGTDARPLTDAEIEAKLRTLAPRGGIDGDRVEALIEAVWSIEESDDAGTLMAHAAPL